MALALASTQIRGKAYAIGRVPVMQGPIIVPRIKVKAGAATYVGQVKDCIYWLTLHGLSKSEAASFVSEGLERFDERDRVERAAAKKSRLN